MHFSMGDARFGLTYTTKDDKPICLIYRHYELIKEVPVSLPPFKFEVHNSKLFYHDTGSGDWVETPKFWGLSDNVQETLTGWDTAQLLADIETVHVKRLTMNSLHRLIPKRCDKCFTISIAEQSQQFNQRFCNFCTNEEKCKFAMGDENLGIVYENQAGKPVCLIYYNGRIKTTVPIVSPTIQFRLEGHNLFYMVPNPERWYQIDRFWRLEKNSAAILSSFYAAMLLSEIESKKYGMELTPMLCMGCKLVDIVGPNSRCCTRRLCSACIATNAVKFTVGDKNLGLTYDNHDGLPVCILYENGNVVTEIPVTAGPIKFEVRDSELFFLSPSTKDWIDTRFFWEFGEKSSQSLTSLENASILAKIETLYYNADMQAYRCKQCNCISIKEKCSKNFQRSLCCVCIDQTPREVDNPATEEHKTCTVCMENEIRVSLQPCGHTVLCFKCSTELERDKAPCPICRAKVTQRIKVFLP